MDFNGLTGNNADRYEAIHGGRGFRRCNLEGDRILEFAVTYNLIVSNSLFTKRESQVKLITSWSSGRISN